MRRTTSTTTTTTRTAEVCLYGAASCGHGYLARIQGRDGFFGDGTPHADRGATDALWLALIDLRDAGFRGQVTVHAPGGERSASLELDGRRGRGTLPTFGDLRWSATPVVYAIDVATIQRAGAR
jgi:hypothetical protein